MRKPAPAPLHQADDRPAKRRYAVSYGRFSDPKQSLGDSVARQDADYKHFCELHNLIPGKEVYFDKGLSGHDGSNVRKGRLGDLIASAEHKLFEPDTVVVIEAWDRLGRQEPVEQLDLIRRLLKTEVCIGVCRMNKIYTKASLTDESWLGLSTFIYLAYTESKQKSDRVRGSWVRRRQAALETGRRLGSQLPGWLREVDGEPRLIPEHAATLDHIFRLAADGCGATRIVRELTELVRPAFGTHVLRPGRNRSQFSGRWNNDYVSLILSDRRVLGELQPTVAGKPDVPPLKGYYPQVVSPATFALVRAAQASRVRPAGQPATRERKHTNAFRGLLTDARNGEGFVLHRQTTARPLAVLVTAAGRRGRGRSYTFHYEMFERGVLQCLKELDPRTILPQQPGAAVDRTKALKAQLEAVQDDLVKLNARLRAKYNETLVDLSYQLKEDEKRIADELQDERQRVAQPLSKAWEGLPDLIDAVYNAADPDLARVKFRTGLRAILDDARVLIVPHGGWRCALVQFFFRGGAIRTFLISYRHPGAGQPITAFKAHSFARPGRPNLDLRKAADVAKVEKGLLQTMTDELAEYKAGAKQRNTDAVRAYRQRKAAAAAEAA